jgi:hypothetical protein
MPKTADFDRIWQKIKEIFAKSSNFWILARKCENLQGQKRPFSGGGDNPEVLRYIKFYENLN